MRALAELDARSVRAVLLDIDETLTRQRLVRGYDKLSTSRLLFDERFEGRLAAAPKTSGYWLH